MCPNQKNRSPECRHLLIGKVLGPHGILGWLKVKPLTDDPERFKSLKKVFLIKSLSEQFPASFLIEEVKISGGSAAAGGTVFLKLSECSDRNQAAELKNNFVALDKNQARTLPDGRYYIFDLIGLEVFSLKGEKLGVVAQVSMEGAAQPGLFVETKNGERLVPFVKEIVRAVDLANKKIVVKMIEGMWD